MLPLPIKPADCLTEIILPALSLLPQHMSSDRAKVMMVSIALQESALANRWQVINGGGKGPARGLWQFECGSKASKGGVWGVYLHHATHELLRLLCRDRDVNFEPYAIWSMLERDDVLAAGVARLMLYTDPFPLPDVADEDGAWDYYVRVWRPGKPHRKTWALCHTLARDVVKV